MVGGDKHFVGGVYRGVPVWGVGVGWGRGVGDEQIFG